MVDASTIQKLSTVFGVGIELIPTLVVIFGIYVYFSQLKPLLNKIDSQSRDHTKLFKEIAALGKKLDDSAKTHNKSSDNIDDIELIVKDIQKDTTTLTAYIQISLSNNAKGLMT